MILEKIKENMKKVVFFTINGLVIIIGAIFVNQDSLKVSLDESEAKNKAELEALNLASSKSALLKARSFEKAILDDRKQKIDSIVANPEVVSRQETIAVAKTIPGATRTIKVPADGSSGSSKSSTSAKKTASAPSTSTKTS